MQPCEGSHDASFKNRFFFYCIGCRTLVSRMLWPVPIGNPAKMLIGCFEKIGIFMAREENLEVMERYHGLERPSRVQRKIL